MVGTPSSAITSVAPLMSIPRVTIVDGVQDQAVVALFHDERHSMSRGVPTADIESGRPNQLSIVPPVLISWRVLAPPRRVRLCTKGLK